ncbi:MAG: ATP-binding protein [Oligoflexales bacterium]
MFFSLKQKKISHLFLITVLSSSSAISASKQHRMDLKPNNYNGFCEKASHYSQLKSSALGDKLGQNFFPEDLDETNSYNQTGRIATSVMGSAILGVTRLFLGEGQGIFSRILNKAADKIGNGLADTLIHGIVMPSVVRKQRKALAPDLYENSTMTLTSYPEKVEGIILDEEASLQVETFVSHLNRSAKMNKPLPSLLLYGPPGTGKTEIAKRIAAEGNYVIKVYSASKIMSQHHQQFAHLLHYVEGLGESAVKRSQPSNSTFSKMKNRFSRLFKSEKSKKQEPQAIPVKHVIFIDEGEALFGGSNMMGQRNEYLREFLTIAGSGSPNISFIVTTNFPDTIDQAAYRRFDYSVEIGLPNLENRIQILNKYISQDIRGDDRQAEITKGLLQSLAHDEEFEEASDGLSGSDLRRISPVIVTAALKRNRGFITRDEVIRAITFDKKNRQKAKLEKIKREAEARQKRQEEITLRQAEMELEERENKRNLNLKKIFGHTDDDNHDHKDK